MKCATCDKEWSELVSAQDSPFIRTKEQFEGFNFLKSGLSMLSTEDFEVFRSTVQFRTRMSLIAKVNLLSQKKAYPRLAWRY